MRFVLIYAPTAATRTLYHRTLTKRDIETYRAKDLAEAMLQLAVFPIDTVIAVDEGHEHELNMLLEILREKYDEKRVIVVSMTKSVPHFERYASTSDFFRVLEDNL